MILAFKRKFFLLLIHSAFVYIRFSFQFCSIRNWLVCMKKHKSSINLLPFLLVHYVIIKKSNFSEFYITIFFVLFHWSFRKLVRLLHLSIIHLWLFFSLMKFLRFEFIFLSILKKIMFCFELHNVIRINKLSYIFRKKNYLFDLRITRETRWNESVNCDFLY